MGLFVGYNVGCSLILGVVEFIKLGFVEGAGVGSILGILLGKILGNLLLLGMVELKKLGFVESIKVGSARHLEPQT